MPQSSDNRKVELKLLVTPVIGLWKRAQSYRLLDSAYGEWLIYENNFPVFYFNVFDEDYREIKELLSELNVTDFLEKALTKKHPNLTTKEHLFGYKINGKAEVKIFSIEKLPLKFLKD